MSLLEADNVGTHRKRPQPLHQASSFRLIPDPITVQSQYRQGHDEGKKASHNTNEGGDHGWMPFQQLGRHSLAKSGGPDHTGSF